MEGKYSHKLYMGGKSRPKSEHWTLQSVIVLQSSNYVTGLNLRQMWFQVTTQNTPKKKKTACLRNGVQNKMDDRTTNCGFMEFKDIEVHK